MNILRWIGIPNLENELISKDYIYVPGENNYYRYYPNVNIYKNKRKQRISPEKPCLSNTQQFFVPGTQTFPLFMLNEHYTDTHTHTHTEVIPTNFLCY